MKLGSSDCVDLNNACKVLAKSRAVQNLVKNAVGIKAFPTALHQMQAGMLEGDIGSMIDALLSDAIRNDPEQVWAGFIHQSHDNYPVHVNGYHGVFWVWAMEYDPVGYFMDEDSAVSFARYNWENVYKDGEVPEEDEDSVDDEIRCPYCDTNNSCDHFLLMADKTFRSAAGGLLHVAFNSRWEQITKFAESPDFHEREAFEELLNEVASISDVALTSSPDNKAAMPSTYCHYFCSSKKRCLAALKKFSKAQLTTSRHFRSAGLIG